MGTSRDASVYSYAVRPCYTYEDYSIYYRSSWACRKVVETLPKLMCRKWGKLTFSNKSNLNLGAKIEGRHKELSVRKKFKDAQIQANLHGRCYLLVENGEDNLSVPIKKSKKISRLTLLSSRKLKPQNTSGYSIIYPDFYVIHNAYEGYKEVKQQSCDRIIDKSRVLVFRGNDLPEEEVIRNNGSEASLLEPFINVWQRYFSGSASMSQILNNLDLFVHYIDGLLETIAQDDNAESGIQQRLAANLLCRSAYKGFVADKEKESLDFISRNLNGIKPLSERQESELIAASGLPRSVLFGEFAAGLDATGKMTGEQAYLNDLVEESQNDKFAENLYYLNKLIWGEKETPKEPEEWGWKWEKLHQETSKEKAEVFKIYSEADANNIENQIYNSSEARTRHKENEFSSEIALAEEEEND